MSVNFLNVRSMTSGQTVTITTQRGNEFRLFPEKNGNALLFKGCDLLGRFVRLPDSFSVGQRSEFNGLLKDPEGNWDWATLKTSEVTRIEIIG